MEFPFPENEPRTGRFVMLRLADGGWVYVRPIRPADKTRIARGLDLMSSESRYLRFFTPVQHLSPQQLQSFTEVDQHQHVAWVALNPADLDYPGYGIGRYVCSAADPTQAEIAITVIDPHQKRGIGTLLFAILYLEAIQKGVRVLLGNLLPENKFLVDWLASMGAVSFYEDGLYRASIPVYPDYQDRFDPEQAAHFLDILQQVASQPEFK